MSVWTVEPEEVKIDLTYDAPDGTAFPFWILVKKRLTIGESRRVMTAGWTGMSGGGAAKDGAEQKTFGDIQVDWKRQTFARTETYVRGWSLEENGHALPLTRASIEALHPEVYEIIENAITAHVEAMAIEKKVTPGLPAPSPTSI